MVQKSIIFSDLERQPLDFPWGKTSDVLMGHEGSGSGGYAHHILNYAAQELFGIKLEEMMWKTVR